MFIVLELCFLKILKIPNIFLWITYDAHFYLGQMLDLKKKFEMSSQDYNDYVVEDLK